MPISDELAAVYGSAPTYRYYIETLSLRHPGFTDNGQIYITNQVNGWAGKTETGANVTYRYLPFVVVPPKEEEQANLSLQVAIDNVSREIMEQLESAAGRPEQPILCVYRIYLNDDPDTVQNNPPLKLDVAGVVATADAVSFTASIANFRQKPFPAELYTTDNFPGLAR